MGVPFHVLSQRALEDVNSCRIDAKSSLKKCPWEHSVTIPFK